MSTDPVAVSTGCLYDLDIPTEEAVTALAGIGVSDVEVFLQGSPEMRPAFVRSLAATCRDAKVRVGSLHPYVFGFEHLLYTSYRRQRDWARQQCERYLDICAELGAGYYVAHGPPRHHVMHDGRFSERYLATTAELARSAADHGVVYCLENVSYGLIRDVEDALVHRARLAEEFGVRVPFVLDFKSAWKVGTAPQHFAAALPGDVAFAHVSFVDRAAQRFGLMPLDDAPDPDVAATIRRLRSGGPLRLVLEVFEVPDLAALARAVAALRAHVSS